MSIDLIIRGAKCVSHRGIENSDIAVRDGIIVAIGQFVDVKADHIINGDGLHILPGLIDSDFQFTDQVETVETGTKAALMGGVTSIISKSKDATNQEIWCDHGYFEQACKANIDKLDTLERQEGCAGIYLTMANINDQEAITDDKSLLKVMENGDRRVVVHAEDQQRLDQRLSFIEKDHVSSHAVWRDQKVALNGTRRILAIARAGGRRVHLAHISTENEMAMVAANKDIATLSVSPIHLSFASEDCYDHYGNYAQTDPPIREENNRLGLYKAISGAIVDMLGSHHNAQSIAQKEQQYPLSTSGIPSVQTMLPLMLNHVNNGVFSLQTLMDLTSAGPARIFNIANKGRLAVGYDADFTLIDLKKKWILEDDDVMSGCGWDLSAGQQFTGKVIGTMVRGHMAMWNGEITKEATGKPLKFTDTFRAFEKE